MAFYPNFGEFLQQYWPSEFSDPRRWSTIEWGPQVGESVTELWAELVQEKSNQPRICRWIAITTSQYINYNLLSKVGFILNDNKHNYSGNMHMVLFCFIRVIPFMRTKLQYIPRNMHTVFDLLCFVVVIHWLIFPYPSGLLHWHCGNLTLPQCQQSNPDEYG